MFKPNSTEDLLSKESQALEFRLSRLSGKTCESQQQQKWDVLKSLKCWTLPQYRAAVSNGEVNGYTGKNKTAERKYASGWAFNYGSRKWRIVDNMHVATDVYICIDTNILLEEHLASWLCQLKQIRSNSNLSTKVFIPTFHQFCTV
jgi:hypothetical protein